MASRKKASPLRPSEWPLARLEALPAEELLALTRQVATDCTIYQALQSEEQSQHDHPGEVGLDEEELYKAIASAEKSPVAQAARAKLSKEAGRELSMAEAVVMTFKSFLAQQEP